MLPNGKTFLIALFGKELSYSKSPGLQNTWASNENLNFCYLPITATTGQHFVSLVSALISCPNFLGGNITNPYKSVIVENAPQLGIQCDEIVRHIGAANTLFRNAGEWHLTNTDIAGIKASLCSLGIPCIKDLHPEQQIKSWHAVVLGAGGAAAATAFTLATHFPQFSLSVVCRSLERAHPYLKSNPADFQIANSFDDLSDSPGLTFKNGGAHQKETTKLLLINTLPLGQKEENNPLCEKIILRELSQYPEKSWFFDMTYGNPPAVQIAKQQGIRAMDGSQMLETQAFKSFSIWKDSLLPEQ